MSDTEKKFMPVAREGECLVHAETRERIAYICSVTCDGTETGMYASVPGSVPTVKPLPPTPEERAQELFRRYHVPFNRVQDAPNLVKLVTEAIIADRAAMKASEA